MAKEVNFEKLKKTAAVKSLANVYFNKNKIKRKTKVKDTKLGDEAGSKMHQKGIIFAQTQAKNLNKTFRALYPFKPLINNSSRELIKRSKTPRPAIHSPKKSI